MCHAGWRAVIILAYCDFAEGRADAELQELADVPASKLTLQAEAVPAEEDDVAINLGDHA
jgi:hypothetical protein